MGGKKIEFLALKLYQKDMKKKLLADMKLDSNQSELPAFYLEKAAENLRIRKKIIKTGSLLLIGIAVILFILMLIPVKPLQKSDSMSKTPSQTSAIEKSTQKGGE
ncbi:MAG TPA: hypothetical protein DHW82_07370 [Spirochaetia bacterium]|nr:MAG: hypothetical protein A2Y41_12185 [Spirochaetes bacterium GWB1_36_13]HCL56812.1 hypothetical protein [Spirochaetia bacterium]